MQHDYGQPALRVEPAQPELEGFGTGRFGDAGTGLVPRRCRRRQCRLNSRSSRRESGKLVGIGLWPESDPWL